MLQFFSPEQTKLVNDWGREIGHDIIWGLMLWGLARTRKAIKGVRPGIVADVTENVKAHFDNRLKTHEESDTRLFNQITGELLEIKSMMGSRPRHPAHGD